MWTYEQKTGKLFDRSGRLVATGYSGQPEARNNPARESDVGVGPIPSGCYEIQDPRDGGPHGPYVLPLEPRQPDRYGRSGFLIHGDSIGKPGTASHGCIILGRDVRSLIGQSPDRLLHVLPPLEAA
jgi:hypothetical protein